MFSGSFMPYTLVGPTVTRLVQDPLAVLGLNNRLYMNWIELKFFYEIKKVTD